VLSDDALLPRQSGSLEWRQSRAEMGDKADDVMSMMPGYANQDKKSSVQNKVNEILAKSKEQQKVVNMD